MKRERAKRAQRKRSAVRLLDGLMDTSTVTLLEDTLDHLRQQLRDQLRVPTVELDNGQAIAVLALLEAVFLGTRRAETLKRLQRAQWIYLDFWHQGIQQPKNIRKKIIIGEMCKGWNLGETAIKRQYEKARNGVSAYVSILGRRRVAQYLNSRL